MAKGPGTPSPRVDVRDLNSVRRALSGADAPFEPEAGEVILGDDWLSAEGWGRRSRLRRLARLRDSPLARKIVVFNLLAIVLLAAGMLWIAPTREGLAAERAGAMAMEAVLVADLVEARLSGDARDGAAIDGAGIGGATAEAFRALRLPAGGRGYLLDAEGRLLAASVGADPEAGTPAPEAAPDSALDALWAGLQRVLSPAAASSAPEEGGGPVPPRLVARALAEGVVAEPLSDADGGALFLVAAPVVREGAALGVVAVRSGAGEIEALVWRERAQVLRMFVVGVAVSVGLSLVLASTIANPLADLAAAAEVGRDRNARAVSPSRVRIPDLTARPDEIGRLSAALRGMVAALYERIEANEQFAADVAHEIKNPLASLRSAVGSFPFAKREEQKQKLLEIIEHDVRRLDRLVSDISNASRLDSELVKEEEKPFDLIKMLASLDDVFAEEARARGIDLITDLPPQPIVLQGLEGRLAQVFVNLISNAISFCEDGDAIRVWARRRENRVLVVVEDTGPGIPEDALQKIFQRFYSERPEGQFGNNSGLGLAISKQIVEAHGGVIWAENIRPTDADPGADPLGARFVVGLPL
ncbi:sensor histidine kinase [Rubellimicrobium aerolatum]|uniref:histidine kinase n=1 Tax=Rubellimicrobium aerolatum TaxID=490979 RepID=A0ABW0SHC1_9RHOB|nr:ATP-binding protein [Rubellimicrobium aerolatum]MBP1807555.1 two-component system sensor histidine kinase ChvG [Rubellimicrobium aerolatum]